MPPSPADPAKASPLSFPAFRAIWFAAMVSNIGGMIHSVGAGWVMTAMTDSVALVALVQAATSLPILLFGLLAGAMADNFDRRTIMLAAQSFMLLVSLCLAALAAYGLLTPTILLVLVFLVACGAALSWPAMQVSIADMVPRAVMPKAVAFNGMGVNVARSIGPALGGALISAFGAATAFAVNTLSYLGLIHVLTRWKPEPEVRQLPREKMLLAMNAGLRYAWMSSVFRAVIARAFAFGILASAVQALMPLVARDLLGGGSGTFGLLLSAFGAGAIIGALTSGKLRRRWSSEVLVRGACLLAAAGTLGVAVSSEVAITLVAMLMCGASWLIAMSTFNVTIQMAAPRWVVARGLALYQTAAFGGIAVGSWSFGTFAGATGIADALWWAGIGLVAVAAAGLFLPIAVRSEMDLGPRTDWEIPETVVPVNLRTGPIVMSLEYRIADKDALDFVSLMSERSRILRRDGARRWSLCRDLSDPELWIERYQLPTWYDYVALNQRRTQDDQKVQESIRQLLAGGEHVAIRRMIERPSGAMPWSRAVDEDIVEASARNG